MTGKPGMLQSMGLQKVRHGLATEQQQYPEASHLTSLSMFSCLQTEQ